MVQIVNTQKMNMKLVAYMPIMNVIYRDKFTVAAAVVLYPDGGNTDDAQLVKRWPWYPYFSFVDPDNL